jgi:hypothetical protein
MYHFVCADLGWRVNRLEILISCLQNSWFLITVSNLGGCRPTVNNTIYPLSCQRAVHVSITTLMIVQWLQQLNNAASADKRQYGEFTWQLRESDCSLTNADVISCSLCAVTKIMNLFIYFIRNFVYIASGGYLISE